MTPTLRPSLHPTGRRLTALIGALALVAGLLLIVPTPSRADTSWTTPVALSATGQYRKDPRITSSSDGSTLTAVWAANDGSNYIAQAATSTDGGATWSAPVDLSAGGNDAHSPHLVGSADGARLTAVWTYFDNESFAATMQSATSTDTGVTWGTPVQMTTDGDTANFEPHVTGSSDGLTLTTVWMAVDLETFEPAGIEATSSTDGGATWSDPATISAGGDDGYAFYPEVTSAADGTVQTAVWDEHLGDNFVAKSATTTNSGTSWNAFWA